MPHKIQILKLNPTMQLVPEAIEQFARQEKPLVKLSGQSRQVMRRSQKTLGQLRAKEKPIYGVTTGFGPFVRYAATKPGSESHGLGLISHLCAGFGNPAADEIVRAAMIIRARTLAQGHSAVSPEVVDAYLNIIFAGIVPEVPEMGSVGASGDLIPLAFLARALRGLGHVRMNGRRLTAAVAMKRAGLQTLKPVSRDVLGLVNGTSFMTAYAALALCRAERLIEHAHWLTGWAYRLLGCRAQALDPRLHRARGHLGQMESAKRILHHAMQDGPFEDAARPLQEVYSLRCAPQILGACMDQLAHARTLIEREINGVNDNPLIFADSAEGPMDALHGGNFQGQQIAFAADTINSAITQVAVLVERQIDVVLSPIHNGDAPLLLAWEPGPCSGMAGAQITATALVADLRHHNQPAATSSIPTNGGNQDVVSMGTNAARHAFHQTPRCAAVLSVMALCLHRLRDLRRVGRTSGIVGTVPAQLPACPSFKQDISLCADIQRIAGELLLSSQV
jgi:histidine ammonia-lyase/tyrosine ammonia-lyase